MQPKNRLINCISSATHIPSKRICMSTNIREDLGLDSLDYMLVIVKIENYFNVNLSEEQIAKIETVKDLFNILPAPKRMLVSKVA